MGEPMTPEAEAAIRARLAAATPGPWLLATRGGEQAHDSVWPADLSAETRIAIIERTDDHPGDARLIAHAPEDLATLLAEVERLRAGRQRLRSALLHQAAAMARRDTVADAQDLGLISRAAYLRARPALERADAAAMDLHRAAMRALEYDNA